MPQPTAATIPQDGPRTAEGRPPAAGTTTKAVRGLLESDDTYATTLLVWALDTYGMECLEWHPTTLKMEIESDFKVRLPKANFDKLLAAVTILTTDLFFKDAARFVQLANILSGDDFQPDEFDPADAVECALAVTEALLLVPPDQEDAEPFSDDVRRYIGLVLKEEGFVTPPDILRIALGGDSGRQVDNDYGSDPETHAAIRAAQKQKTDEVEGAVKAMLAGLLEQLKTLPLSNGSTADLTQKIATVIRAIT